MELWKGIAKSECTGWKDESEGEIEVSRHKIAWIINYVNLFMMWYCSNDGIRSQFPK